MQAMPIMVMTAVAPTAVGEYRFAGFDGAQADAAGMKVLGVAQYAAAPGAAFAVTVLGTERVKSGAAIAIGPKGLTPVKTDATGRAIAHGGVGEIAGYLIGAPALAVDQTVEILLSR